MTTRSLDKEIVIISGLSGAGKSTALHVLEDNGFFSIDNFPGELLPNLLELLKKQNASQNQKIALVMDARNKEFLKRFPEYDRLLKRKLSTVRIFFLDARDDILLRRFSETRRRHPLAPQGRVLSGIQKERKLLRPLRDAATHFIDTSSLSIHELKKTLLHQLKLHSAQSALSIHLLSFGYHFGLPTEADLIFDVRFLPNPHFVPKLGALSGNNQKVQKYVLEKKETRDFLKILQKTLHFLLKCYLKEGKTHLTIAFGCTGGRHRSVVMTNRIGRDLMRWGSHVTITHRDLMRSPGGD